MAAPAYNSSGTIVAELDNSIGCVLPATLLADDIVILVTCYRGASTVVFDTPTHASLTFLPVQPQSGGAIAQQRVWWARCAGGEGGSTVTCTKNSGALLFCATAHRFTGVKTTGNPYDETPGALQENQNVGATVTFEAMTLGGDERLIVTTYFQSDDDETTPNWTTVDVTFTKRNDQITGIGADGTIVIHTGPNGAGDTAISATSFTQVSADSYSVQQFALLPQVAAAPGPAHVNKHSSMRALNRR